MQGGGRRGRGGGRGRGEEGERRGRGGGEQGERKGRGRGEEGEGWQEIGRSYERQTGVRKEIRDGHWGGGRALARGLETWWSG